MSHLAIILHLCYNWGGGCRSYHHPGAGAAYAPCTLGGFLLPVQALLDGCDSCIKAISLPQDCEDAQSFSLKQCRHELFQLITGHAIVLLHVVHLLQWFVAGAVALSTAQMIQQADRIRQIDKSKFSGSLCKSDSGVININIYGVKKRRCGACHKRRFFCGHCTSFLRRALDWRKRSPPIPREIVDHRPRAGHTACGRMHKGETVEQRPGAQTRPPLGRGPARPGPGPGIRIGLGL